MRRLEPVLIDLLEGFQCLHEMTALLRRGLDSKIAWSYLNWCRSPRHLRVTVTSHIYYCSAMDVYGALRGSSSYV
jgi:hypothetical protein